MSFLPKSRTQKYQINNDGTQTVRCYSPINPQYYKDKNGNYYDIDLSHTSSLNNSNVGNFTLKEKNINSLGIRQDDNKEKYIGIRPDDTQEDGTQQLEWSIVSASVNGNDIPIDLSQNEFVNNNQVNLGNVTLFSTRRYSRQMLHYTGSIDNFELSYKLHLTGLQISNSKHTETTTIRNSVSCSLIDCGNISGSQYTSMITKQTHSESILAMYFTDDTVIKNTLFNPNPYYYTESAGYQQMSGSEFIGDTGSFHFIDRDREYWGGYHSSFDYMSSGYLKDNLYLKFKDMNLANGIKDYILNLTNSEIDGNYIRVKDGKKIGAFIYPPDENVAYLLLALDDITHMSSSFRYKDFDDISHVTLSYSDIMTGIRNEINSYNSLISSTDYYQPDSDNNFVIKDSDNNVKYHISSPVLLDSNFNEVTSDTIHTLREIGDGIYEYKKYPSRNLLLSGISGSVTYIDGTTVYSTAASDGYAVVNSESSWGNAQNASTADSVNTSATKAGSMVKRTSGKMGSFYDCQRGFFSFDTSDISQVISATINLYYHSRAGSQDVIIVKWTEGPTLTTADFDGFDSSTVYVEEIGEGCAPNPGILEEINTSGYNSFPLTSDAETDIVNNDRLDICQMDHTFDYGTTSLGVNGEYNFYWYSSDQSGTDKDPYIDITIPGLPLSRIKILSGNLNLKSGTITIK
jgi:hypothetical protein